ncbi:hypothetical protein MJO28_003494 [Puccinia striiformis f. sp. tritici]|nr:hypothetical protein MJO28_003494 [Puccinia striiformis f. sp. tritici]
MSDDFQAPFPADLKHKYPTKRSGTRKRKFNEMDRARLNVFKDDLVERLAIHFGEQDCAGGEIEASDFFGPNEAELLVTNLHIIECPSDIRKLIGGECFVGQLQWLMDAITIFKLNQEANPASQQTSKPASKKHQPTSPLAHTALALPPQTSAEPLENTTMAISSAGRPLIKKAQADRARELKKMAKGKAEEIFQARKDPLAGFRKASKEKYNIPT